MLAHPFLEKLFNEYQSQTFCPDVIPDSAKLAEEWLMGFVGEDHPEKAAFESLASLGDIENESRLRFFFSLAFCVPSTNTSTIIKAFAGYLRPESWRIGAWIDKQTKDLGPHFKIDVLRAFEDLPKIKFHDIACDIYKVTQKEVCLAAIATDNLKVFRSAMPAYSNDATEEALKYIAKFPLDKSRVIYKDYVLRYMDEYNLVLSKVNRLYEQMLNDFIDGIDFQYWDQSSPALIPKLGLQLKAPDLGQYPAVHKTPEFSKALNEDPTPLVLAFFMFRQNSMLIKSENHKFIAELTAEFRAAGVSPEQIITQGVLGKTRDTTTSLFSALDMLGCMTQEHQLFYKSVYLPYLNEFSFDQIAKACPNDKSLFAVYNITGNKAFLQAGNDQVRSLAMGSDLGL